MNDSISYSEIVSDWVNQFSDELYQWAFHKTQNEETAKDLLQDTFLSAYKSIDSFKGSSAPKTWLFSILKNKINDYYRQSYKRNEVSLDNELFKDNGHWKNEQRPTKWNSLSDTLNESNEFNDVLEKCLTKLPKTWGSILRYKFIEEKDAKEICQEFEIKTSNYWQILHRGKLQLRLCLQKNWF